MTEKVEHAIGSKVTFATGRSGTEYTAEVVGREGQFIVTKDADGKLRKVRPGAARPAA